MRYKKRTANYLSNASSIIDWMATYGIEEDVKGQTNNCLHFLKKMRNHIKRRFQLRKPNDE